MKLRHLCLKHLNPDEVPEGIREDMRWEVEKEITELRDKKRNLEKKIDSIINQRKKYFIPVTKSIQRKINSLEEEITTFLFDEWKPENEAEEIWREYFFCLYEFTFIERSVWGIDMSNVKAIHRHNTDIFENLYRPEYPMSTGVRILDFKYRELYLLYKNLKYPDPVQHSNESLKNKIKMTKESLKLKEEHRYITRLIWDYEDLLSSSLCS